MPGDPLVDPRKDSKPGVIDLAVDVDGNQFLRGFLDLGEDLFNACRLPGAGKTTADGVEWPSSPQARPDLESEITNLGITMVELLGDVVDLEYIGIPEKCLVPHEQVLLHHTILGYL